MCTLTIAQRSSFRCMNPKKNESTSFLSVNSTMILSSSYITKAQMNACACRFHIFAYSPPCFSNPSCVPASTTTESFMYLYMFTLDSSLYP